MKTIVTSSSKEVVIGDNQPTIIIGESINPTGKVRMVKALQERDFSFISDEALRQVKVGAHILDVNACVPGLDEKALLPEVLKTVMESVDVPLCIDSANPRCLEAALKVYIGKPLINSVTGQEQSLQEVLPLVKRFNTAVIGLTIDDQGIPQEPYKRLEITWKIVNRAQEMGIPRENIIIDSLTLTVGTDIQAASKTLETIRLIKKEMGVNQVLGISNISFGLPLRQVINCSFISMVLAEGVTCLITDPFLTRQTVLACDLLLGKDKFARNFLKTYREMKK